MDDKEEKDIEFAGTCFYCGSNVEVEREVNTFTWRCENEKCDKHEGESKDFDLAPEWVH